MSLENRPGRGEGEAEIPPAIIKAANDAYFPHFHDLERQLLRLFPDGEEVTALETQVRNMAEVMFYEGYIARATEDVNYIEQDEQGEQ